MCTKCLASRKAKAKATRAAMKHVKAGTLPKPKKANAKKSPAKKAGAKKAKPCHCGPTKGQGPKIKTPA